MTGSPAPPQGTATGLSEADFTPAQCVECGHHVVGHSGNVPSPRPKGCEWCNCTRSAERVVADLAAERAAHPADAVPGLSERHRDALADTSAAYTQFHGWVLDCCWCEFEAVGKTKAEALRSMQRHYDAVVPEGAEIR